MQNQLQNIRRHYERGAPQEARSVIADAIKDADAKEILSISTLAREFSDFELVKTAYEKLVEIAPTDANFRNLYASSLIQTGDFEAAEANLREALTTNDAHAHSYFNLSMIHRAADGDPLIQKLEDLLRTPNITPSDNYAFRLALGKFYDDTGDYDNAFNHFHAAKQSPNIKYDHDAQKAFFDRIKTAFTKDYMSNNKSLGDLSEAPVFIIGMPRSGSSLLEKMLAEESRVTALGERVEMTLVLEALVKRRKGDTGYLELLPTMPQKEFQQCGSDYINRLAPLAPGADRFIDKNVLNFLRAGFINLSLPNAAIINTKRDPVDTCLSCYFQTFDPAIFPFTFSLADIGKYYGLYNDLMRHWDEVIPNQITHVEYEKVVNTPNEEVKNLLTAINLDTDEYPKKGSAPPSAMVATASAWQARQPIYETSVKRWENYERHLSPLFESLEQSGL